MLSIGKSNIMAATSASGGWAQLLGKEEAQAATHGFGAGVLMVGFHNELLKHLQVDERALAEAALLCTIDRHLGWADRAEMSGIGRLGVVVQPIDDALALSRRARRLHRELRACHLDVDVGYSLRHRHGGLSAAAARADAALDTAAARRP